MTRERNGKKPKVRVFDSMEERDQWQIATYGHVRNAFREPDEPVDGRPVITRDPFWRDESERLTYEHAAETNPRRDGEGAISYIQRLAAIAEKRLKPQAPKAKLPPPAKPMPKKQRELTDGEWNERVNEIERQAEGLKEPKA